MATDSPDSSASFTGRRRARTTRRGVRLANNAARVFITLGGIGTIVAVAGVFLFLGAVVVPLFLPESMTLERGMRLATGVSQPAPLHVAVDEYLNMGWIATTDGTLHTYRLDDGELLETRPLFADRSIVASSFALRDDHVAFALDNNTVQLGTIGLSTTFVEPDELPKELREMPVGGADSFRGGMVERTPESQFRLQQLNVELQDPVKVESEAGIELIDQSVSTKGTIFAMLMEDGELRIARVTQRKNLLTGKVTTRLREGKMQVELPSDGRLPTYLRLAGLGDAVFLAWDDGRVVRIDARNSTQPVFAEELDLVEEENERLTALSFLIGKTSLVSGDSLGRVRIWFRIKPNDAQTPDGAVLVRAHELPPGAAAVTQLAASTRTRMLAAGYADGHVQVFHVTSKQKLAAGTFPGNDAIAGLTVTPKDDALLALAADRIALWQLDAPHPETTLASILQPVWYEGYNGPEDVWQSSSATDDFEPKYGLRPLIFGTLKATFYSMLFGVPLALLAAIYTSEFLAPRVKAAIKPSIEIMASLPSVVLGFLAALFFAPLIEDVVPESLAAFATLPFAFLAGGYFWQLLPSKTATRLQPIRPLMALLFGFPAGLGLAVWLGPPMEAWLFAGDIKAWLDGQIGTGVGGWMILLLPISGLAATLVSNSMLTPAMRRVAGDWSRTSFALLDLAKFTSLVAATIVIAYVAALSLTAVGWDPRGSVVDTYEQRNALVVGFIMGFAVIPIIYTISEDALTAVPESLRSGSLGAGATQWQTAIRVVIPTAMSGLFSAIMIGLGRAVGETMIVLMAAGNTPVMDWNVFNGFRTLSANIAVELPEAVQKSTHFRMLFLAALALFLITFVVNTAAEMVRLRFRKRAIQL